MPSHEKGTTMVKGLPSCGVGDLSNRPEKVVSVSFELKLNEILEIISWVV